MRLYVTLCYTVPVEIDDQHYSDGPDHWLSREEVAARAEDDPDLLDGFGNGPHQVHDVSWHVETNEYHMRLLDEEGPSFQVVAQALPPRSEVADLEAQP